MEVGNGVEVFDYYAPGVSEYGHINLIISSIIYVKLFNGKTHVVLKSELNNKWSLDDFSYSKADYESFNSKKKFGDLLLQKNIKVKDISDKEKEINYNFNVKLNKSDFQKLLDAAIDRQDWEECTRVYKKMEALA